MASASTSTAPVDPYQPSAQGKTITLTTSSPFAPTYLSSVLPPSSASSTYSTRLKGKQLILENPARESRRAQLARQRAAAQAAAKERRERGTLGRREAKRLGLWELRREDAKWPLFLPIHHLWLGYITELLQLPPPPSSAILRSRDPSVHKIPNVPSLQAKLVKADLHGSILSVKRAKNPDLVGAGGIVLRETENTFRVITAGDEQKTIPKRGSVFALKVPLYAVRPSAGAGEAQGEEVGGSGEVEDGGQEPEMEFELYGNQLCFRASERSSRKFKFKETIEL